MMKKNVTTIFAAALAIGVGVQVARLGNMGYELSQDEDFEDAAYSLNIGIRATLFDNVARPVGACESRVSSGEIGFTDMFSCVVNEIGNPVYTSEYDRKYPREVVLRLKSELGEPN